jgi:hypothetical protein
VTQLKTFKVFGLSCLDPMDFSDLGDPVVTLCLM